MSDFAEQLEAAAKLTSRLVQGLQWLEREGPTEGRLDSINRDVQRLAKDFGDALDKTNERSHGPEIDKLRYLNGTVAGLLPRLIELSKNLHLRLHVLDALEKLDEQPGE